MYLYRQTVLYLYTTKAAKQANTTTVTVATATGQPDDFFGFGLGVVAAFVMLAVVLDTVELVGSVEAVLTDLLAFGLVVLTISVTAVLFQSVDGEVMAALVLVVSKAVVPLLVGNEVVFIDGEMFSDGVVLIVLLGKAFFVDVAIVLAFVVLGVNSVLLSVVGSLPYMTLMNVSSYPNTTKAIMVPIFLAIMLKNARLLRYTIQFIYLCVNCIKICIWLSTLFT